MYLVDVFIVRSDDGEEIDSSKGGEPFAYLHGHGNIVPGLEKEMVGKEAGDHVKAHVSPEEGYGVHDPELDMRVPKEVFPPEAAAELQPDVAGYVAAKDSAV